MDGDMLSTGSRDAATCTTGATGVSWDATRLGFIAVRPSGCMLSLVYVELMAMRRVGPRAAA